VTGRHKPKREGDLEEMHGKIFMNVPYEEKDELKSLGAKWNPTLKQWYYKGPVSDYIQFAKWISEGRELTIIACEDIFVLEGVKACFKCEKPTRVIGLGINEHVRLFQREDGSYEIDVIENYIGWEPLHVGWVDDEKDIPPALLQYLLEKYNVRKGYSKTAGNCFANHCDSCNVIQLQFPERVTRLTRKIRNKPQ
jgi:hypothetical protein